MRVILSSFYYIFNTALIVEVRKVPSQITAPISQPDGQQLQTTIESFYPPALGRSKILVYCNTIGLKRN